MDRWTELSIELANSRNYLDELYRVYPLAPNCIRSMDSTLWQKVEYAFSNMNNIQLIDTLLQADLFPIKDSYVPFLRADRKAVDRNPNTIARLCGKLYEMGLDAIYDKCTEPKETNRQIGPLFKNWICSGALGIKPVGLDEFMESNHNAVLDASDSQMGEWAREHLGYKRNKGLDFVARFNGKYVIGEAKFLSDYGGHQNAQLEDALITISQADIKAVKVAILDGVVWLKNKGKMFRAACKEYESGYVMSALFLRDFLYSI